MPYYNGINEREITPGLLAQDHSSHTDLYVGDWCVGRYRTLGGLKKAIRTYQKLNEKRIRQHGR